MAAPGMLFIVRKASRNVNQTHGVCAWKENRRKETARNLPVAQKTSYELFRADPICTNCGCTGGGAMGSGFRFCGSRQLSSIPTCCTQDTVHFGPQNLSVKYS